MAKNSIRVKSSTEYVIEVNDAGETIVFDISDTGLLSRLFVMYEKIDAITKEYEIKAKEIDARPDEPLSTAQLLNEKTGQMENRSILTRNQHDGAAMMDQFFSEARSALDAFLGEGACRKIFGDKNYYGMFNDLLEQLEPHFKKMGLDAKKLRATATSKYMPNRTARRALK